MGTETLAHEEWKGNTGGKPWMQRFMKRWFRYLPIILPYFCMGWVIPFYMLFNHQGYISCYRYFRHRHEHNMVRAFFDVYATQFRFGQIIIDRFAMYSGKEFNLRVEGEEHYLRLDNEESGFLQISSHVGNYEMAGYCLRPKQKSFNALIFGGETAQVMEGRTQMFDGKNINMIPVKPDMSHIFILNNVLAEGNIVSMPGDRIFGSSKSITCDFLGAQAKFPMGPFAMAVQRDVPVLSVCVFKTGLKKYVTYVFPLERDKSLSRQEQMADLAKKFVKNLEDMVRQYPHQWFNFFDFWLE